MGSWKGIEMEVIETRIDTSGQEYRQNYQRMEALVVDLKKELEVAQNDRSERARARLAQQNKLSVRERLDLLLDKNTPFLEIAPLAATSKMVMLGEYLWQLRTCTTKRSTAQGSSLESVLLKAVR